jgi:molybdopterin converting factor small subunit
MTETIIRIPTPLRPLTDGAAEVAVEGIDVSSALRALGRRHEGILERVLDEKGALRPFVNVFVGSTNLRELDGLETRLSEGDVLAIIPAVAGGGRP